MNTPDKKKRLTFRYRCGLGLSLLVLFGFSLCFLVVQALLQSGPSDAKPFELFLYPLLILMNLIPLFLIMGVCFFACRRFWVGVLVAAVPYVIGLFINHYKVMYRKEPFSPADLSLAGEAGNMLQNYVLTPNAWVISGIALAVLLLAASIVLFRPATITPKTRILGVAVCVLLIVVAFSTCYRNKTVYDRLAAPGESYNPVSASAGKGFWFTFLTDISTVHYQKPDGYSAGAAREVLARYAAADTLDPQTTPNVIAIMSEAFFDPSEAENLEFLPGRDPLANYKKILAQSYHGKIVVPGFAGGTAATESEFLTGINTALVSTAMPTVYTSYVKRRIDCLPQLFSRSNFETDAIHPGHPWFYNRQNVYPCLGFDAFTTKDDLPADVEQVHYYVSDRVTTDLIIDHYNEYLAGPKDKGYFNFTVTIQNHGPYAEEIVDREPRMVRPEGVSDELYAVMDNYMEGLADADRMLLRLTTYLDTVQEPTVLVFFGDHLPYFDAEFEGLRALGYDIDPETKSGMLHRYQTPYFIWQNKAARQGSTTVRTGLGPTISANFLSTLLLEQMNVPLPPFYAFLQELRQDVQVIAPTYYMVDGVMTKELDEATEQKLQEYRWLQYYHLFDWGR